MATLRMFYQLGVRYLTLTHSCNTPWWIMEMKIQKAMVYLNLEKLLCVVQNLIKEMNRIGMIIDLAHVSQKVMKDVLDISEAPVIFSHSSAYKICPSKRNVPDDILIKVAEKKGIVMVNFYNNYVTCNKIANLSDVADHFDHIKHVGGAAIVGFGGDYDGVSRVPQGLEDVSKYPDLVAELLNRGWTDKEVKEALGENLLRVFKKVEEVL
ncbi:DPEP1 Dipeptidase, partial [Polypterus senegalus]|nr:DPEP1 Dipeptidase [Polypterus senegalus]